MTLAENNIGITNIDCFCDTGSPFSIANPPLDGRKDDKLSRYMIDKNKIEHEECVLQGVGGGVIEKVNVAYKVEFLLGGR